MSDPFATRGTGNELEHPLKANRPSSGAGTPSTWLGGAHPSRVMDLRDEIAELFAGLDGSDRHDAAIYEHAVRLRTASERTRQWRKDNPLLWKLQRRRSRKRWEAAHPKKRAARKLRQINRRREHYRMLWRKNSAAYRARKKLLVEGMQ